MHRITAVLHTHNDALRLGRCLETLYPCDEIIVVDHGSEDATVRSALDYAAHVARAQEGTGPEEYFRVPGAEWVLCLDAHESLSEALSASLYQWKLEQHPDDSVFSMLLREELHQGWVEHREPQTRLVPASWDLWDGWFPLNDTHAQLLEGEILRFVLP
jgi:glycosyltransferase involved in cell wall biosynthesis